MSGPVPAACENWVDRVYKPSGPFVFDLRMNAMFSKHDNTGYRESLKGIRQKTLVYGEKTLMVEFRLQKGAVLPMHKHPHEQTGTCDL